MVSVTKQKKTHIKKTALTIAMPGLMHRPQDR